MKATAARAFLPAGARAWKDPRPWGDRPVRRAAALAGWVLAGGLVAFAAFIAVSSLVFTVLTHNPIPQADEWASFELYDGILRHGGPWLDLFSPHNEHRIFFPRLVLFSDYLLFGGLGIFDKVVILIVQALHAALFIWLIRRSGAAPAAQWGLGAVAVALLFSLYQSENFDWAFQVQFVGVFACASLCCTLFALGLDADRAGRPSARLLAAAALLALVNTFTMANGLLVGIVLAVMACLARARPPLIAATVGSAAALAALFGLGYRLTNDHVGAAELLRGAPTELAFMAGYLGNFAPFGLSGAVAFGTVGLAAAFGLTVRAALARETSPVRLALLGIALFAAASAALTALGRTGIGFYNIQSSRYSTGAAAFWAAILVHGWSSARSRVGRRAARAAAAAAALLLLVECGTAQLPQGLDMERRAADYGGMEDALLLGLIDGPTLDAFQEPVDQARRMAPELRRLHLSIFRGPDADRVGRPLSEVEAPGATPIPCAGAFASARAVPDFGRDGVAVSGSTGLRSRFGRPVRVYVVDGGRRIVGFARTGFGGGTWKGYARVPAGADVTAYGISDGGRACRLGSAVVSAAPPA